MGDVEAVGKEDKATGWNSSQRHTLLGGGAFLGLSLPEERLAPRPLTRAKPNNQCVHL